MDYGQSIPFLLENLLYLLIKLDASTWSEFYGRAISKILIAHLLELKISQIEGICLIRSKSWSLLAALVRSMMMYRTAISRVVGSAVIDCARISHATVFLDRYLVMPAAICLIVTITLSTALRRVILHLLLLDTIQIFCSLALVIQLQTFVFDRSRLSLRLADHYPRLRDVANLRGEGFIQCYLGCLLLAFQDTLLIFDLGGEPQQI